MQGIGTAQALDRKSKNDRPRAAPLQDIGVKAHRRQRLRDSRHALQRMDKMWRTNGVWRRVVAMQASSSRRPPSGVAATTFARRARRRRRRRSPRSCTRSPWRRSRGTKRTVAGRRAARVAALVAAQGVAQGAGSPAAASRRRPREPVRRGGGDRDAVDAEIDAGDADELRREVGMGRIDAGVEDRDDHARAHRAVPRGGRRARRRRPRRRGAAASRRCARRPSPAPSRTRAARCADACPRGRVPALTTAPRPRRAAARARSRPCGRPRR